jgi:hypothetical protein
MISREKKLLGEVVILLSFYICHLKGHRSDIPVELNILMTEGWNRRGFVLPALLGTMH